MWHESERGGSVPQPGEELTSVDRTEAGGGSVVGAEVVPQSVILCCLAGGAPADRPVAGIGAGFQQFGEGGEGHQRVSGESIVADQAAT